jgi:hypothetical protein
MRGYLRRVTFLSAPGCLPGLHDVAPLCGIRGTSNTAEARASWAPHDDGPHSTGP